MATPCWEEVVSGSARVRRIGGAIIIVSQVTGNRRNRRGESEKELKWERKNDQAGENLVGWTQVGWRPKVALFYMGMTKQNGRTRNIMPGKIIQCKDTLRSARTLWVAHRPQTGRRRRKKITHHLNLHWSNVCPLQVFRLLRQIRKHGDKVFAVTCRYVLFPLFDSDNKFYQHKNTSQSGRFLSFFLGIRYLAMMRETRHERSSDVEQTLEKPERLGAGTGKTDAQSGHEKKKKNGSPRPKSTN